MVAHLAGELVAEILQPGEELADPPDLLRGVRGGHHPRVGVGVDQLQFFRHLSGPELVVASGFDPGKGIVRGFHHAGHRLVHGFRIVLCLFCDLHERQPPPVSADQHVPAGEALPDDQRLHESDHPDIVGQLVDPFGAVEVARVLVDHVQGNVPQLAPSSFVRCRPSGDVAQSFRDVERHQISPPSSSMLSPIRRETKTR